MHNAGLLIMNKPKHTGTLFLKCTIGGWMNKCTAKMSLKMTYIMMSP